MKRWMKIGIAICVLAAAGATTAWATGIVGGRFVASDGSITACVRNADGSVRFLDASAKRGPAVYWCKKNETLVPLEQKPTSAGSLVGLACSTSGGAPGETALTFADSGAGTLYCDTGTGAPAVCGDGVTKSPEACDSGGKDSASCDGLTCSASTCGDGYVNTPAGEQCDTGGSDTSYCVGGTCKISTCGDGYPNATAGEQCDTGGESPSCNANCTVAVCGDGILNKSAGEQCDDGNQNGPGKSCLADCTLNPTQP